MKSKYRKSNKEGYILVVAFVMLSAIIALSIGIFDRSISTRENNALVSEKIKGYFSLKIIKDFITNYASYQLAKNDFSNYSEIETYLNNEFSDHLKIDRFDHIYNKLTRSNYFNDSYSYEITDRFISNPLGLLYGKEIDESFIVEYESYLNTNKTIDSLKSNITLTKKVIPTVGLQFISASKLDLSNLYYNINVYGNTYTPKSYFSNNNNSYFYTTRHITNTIPEDTLNPFSVSSDNRYIREYAVASWGSSAYELAENTSDDDIYDQKHNSAYIFNYDGKNLFNGVTGIIINELDYPNGISINYDDLNFKRLEIDLGLLDSTYSKYYFNCTNIIAKELGIKIVGDLGKAQSSAKRIATNGKVTLIGSNTVTPVLISTSYGDIEFDSRIPGSLNYQDSITWYGFIHGATRPVRDIYTVNSPSSARINDGISWFGGTTSPSFSGGGTNRIVQDSCTDTSFLYFGENANNYSAIGIDFDILPSSAITEITLCGGGSTDSTNWDTRKDITFQFNSGTLNIYYKNADNTDILSRSLSINAGSSNSVSINYLKGSKVIYLTLNNNVYNIQLPEIDLGATHLGLNMINSNSSTYIDNLVIKSRNFGTHLTNKHPTSINMIGGLLVYSGISGNLKELNITQTALRELFDVSDKFLTVMR